MSSRDMVLDDMPTFITRLVADSGCISTGGAAQVGKVFCTSASRSCTSCRACIVSVPSLKIELEVRELRSRLRAHDVEPVDTVERLLHRRRDERSPPLRR